MSFEELYSVYKMLLSLSPPVELNLSNCGFAFHGNHAMAGRLLRSAGLVHSLQTLNLAGVHHI
jgi:hypothetical protein